MSKMGGNTGGAGGGFFGSLTPQDRAEIIGNMLQGVAGNAMNSGSPVLAAAAPILSAMIGGRAQSRANQWQQEQHAPIGEELIGDNPQARRMMEILSQPNLPEPYRRIAQQRLDAALGSGGRRRSGSGGGARPSRQEQPAAAPEPAAPATPDPIASAMTAPAPRVMTEIPPVSSLAEPSLEEYANPNDPLGLRNRPPA